MRQTNYDLIFDAAVKIALDTFQFKVGKIRARHIAKLSTMIYFKSRKEPFHIKVGEIECCVGESVMVMDYDDRKTTVVSPYLYIRYEDLFDDLAIIIALIKLALLETITKDVIEL